MGTATDFIGFSEATPNRKSRLAINFLDVPVAGANLVATFAAEFALDQFDTLVWFVVLSQELSGQRAFMTALAAFQREQISGRNVFDTLIVTWRKYNFLVHGLFYHD